MNSITVDFVKGYLGHTTVSSTELILDPRIIYALRAKGISLVCHIFEHSWEELAQGMDESILPMTISWERGSARLTKVKALERAVALALNERIGQYLINYFKVMEEGFFQGVVIH
jgi:hypothetical protein